MTMPMPWPTVEEAVRRIRQREDAVRAFVSTRLDAALVEDRARASEPRRSLLHRVPYSLKDTWDTAGIVTTGGSYRYRERIPAESAPIHDALRDAGAILVGKTNLSDMSLAPEAASYVGGVTANPFDAKRTAGGSSGGAAAAVAHGMSAFDWGSDIGGSIRLPAAFCGVYGMRLSTETWPSECGKFPCAPEPLRYMDGQGPIASSLGAMREVIRAVAPRLRTGRARRFELRGAVVYAPDRATAGAWPSFAVDIAKELQRAAGEVRIEHGLVSPARAMMIAGGLWASHLEELVDSDKSLTFRDGLLAVISSIFLRGRLGDLRFHPSTAAYLALIGLGRVAMFRDKAKALRAGETFRADMGALWDKGYVVVSPVCTYPPPRHGRSVLQWNLLAHTMPGNVADATAVALPFGRFRGGLPRAVQIAGPPGSEETVIEIAERLLAG